jgi:hypothetical protein
MDSSETFFLGLLEYRSCRSLKINLGKVEAYSIHYSSIAIQYFNCTYVITGITSTMGYYIYHLQVWRPDITLYNNADRLHPSGDLLTTCILVATTH